MRSPTQVAALCAAFVVALSLVSAASAAKFSRSSEARIINVMNRVRTSNGLRPLRFDKKLRAAARSHSADMIRRRYFGHGAFGRRMGRFGVRAPVVGENLAWGTGVYAVPTTVVQSWLASPEHRSNLLRGGFSWIGVGAAVGRFVGKRKATVITADFSGR